MGATARAAVTQAERAGAAPAAAVAVPGALEARPTQRSTRRQMRLQGAPAAARAVLAVARVAPGVVPVALAVAPGVVPVAIAVRAADLPTPVQARASRGATDRALAPAR